MTLILHIGFPKTATTSLQRVFCDEQDALQEQGLFYPIVDQDFKQRYLKTLLYKKGRQQHLKPDQEKLDALRENVRQQTSGVVLFSCEELTNEVDFELGAEHLRPLAEYLQSLGRQIEIVVYLRNPVDYYLSRIQESLKSRPGIIPPSEFDAKMSWVVAQYEEAFGVKVRVRPFVREQLTGESIVQDFFATVFDLVRVSSRDLNEQNVNESISAEVMFALDMLRRGPSGDDNFIQYPAQMGRFIWQSLQRLDAKFGTPSKPKLYASAASEIAAGAEYDLSLLSRDHGINFPASTAVLQESSVPFDARVSCVEEIVSVDRARAFGLMSKLLERGVRSLVAAT